MKFKLNKDGLEGEELKAAEKLEKAFSIEGELTAEQVVSIVDKQIGATLSSETIDKLIKAIDKDNPESVFAAISAVDKRIDDELTDQTETKVSEKSFNDLLEEKLKETHEEIKSAAQKHGRTELGALKAVGNMSIAANFPNSSSFTTDVRNGIIPNPYERLWLRDLLLSGTTDGRVVTYPKEVGGEGGAAAWTDPATDKPQMDFDFEPYSAYVKWVAGYVIIDRDMLDDFSWMASWVRARMLISLKQAENNVILNGTADANPIQGLNSVASAYVATPGITAGPVQNLIDAAYGQIPSDTFGFYYPTTALLTPRDMVRIGLNQASGSGEFDLPAGSVGFAGGKLTVAGLQTIGTTNLAAGDFLTFDKNAAMWIQRMAPELIVVVDAALAKKNQVMLRIEERGTLAVFNNKAIVKGSLNVPPTT